MLKAIDPHNKEGRLTLTRSTAAMRKSGQLKATS
jgi:hypothetical protein